MNTWPRFKPPPIVTAAVGEAIPIYGFTKQWVGYLAYLPVRAAAQDQDRLAHYYRFFNRMCYHHKCKLRFSPELQGESLQILAGYRVKGRKRLIHQQQIRLQYQCTGDSRPLALAPGKLARVGIRYFRDPQAVQPKIRFLV